MMDSFTMALEKVHNGVGQGSILEQIDKRYRKQQRNHPKNRYLVDTEALPTDYTRLRSMAERRGSLGEMSKEQAALIGATFKFIEIQ